MADLNTPDDWWNLVSAHWDAFERCAENASAIRTLPTDGPGRFFDSQLQVAAPNFWERMTKAKAERDHETVYQGLQLIWEAAPDRPDIHSWPRWGDLCDLCSEFWVFDPDDDAALSPVGERVA